MQQFVLVNLGPGFDEALLLSWQIAADTLERIEGLAFSGEHPPERSEEG